MGKNEEGLILNNMTERGLAYWIMDDGSVDGKTTIIHTSGFKEDEVKILSKELNEKFGFNSEVIIHKSKYFVIKIPYINGELLRNKISPYIHGSMERKLAKINYRSKVKI